MTSVAGIIDGVETIIWDFNGTLLDDIQVSVEVINHVLENRQLQSLSQDSYRAIFGFPIRDYYQRIGIDIKTESFNVAAEEFITGFSKLLPNCQLHEGVIDVLNYFKHRNIRQFVLSAMEQEKLIASLDALGILNYFEAISGLDNDHAASKVENGKQLLTQHQMDAKLSCMIGDTDHDAEVARAMNIQCILYEGGHQDRQTLEKENVPIIHSFPEFYQHLLLENHQHQRSI